MQKILYTSLVSVITFLLLLTCHLPVAHSEPRPEIYSGNATGTIFTIDGDPSDWEPFIPSLELNTQENPDVHYPVPAYIYFMNDKTNLYVLVDATGDTTDGLDPNCLGLTQYCCDECYLRFDTSNKVIEVEIGTIGGAFLTADFNPPDLEASIGFAASINSVTPHRIYEMKIPLTALQAYPGQVINFFSPLIKEICEPYGGSIPFDGGSPISGDWRDNVYPYWLKEEDVNTWALLNLSNAEDVQQHTLAIDIAGIGRGTVTSSPGGIECGSDCSEAYSQGTTVTLTAEADYGSTFSGWSGGGCSGTGQCIVTMNSDENVTAVFSPATAPITDYTLTVTKAGTGNGTITSSPKGINCGSECNETFPKGRKLKRITLKVKPDASSTFSGWGGDCQAYGTKTSCRLTMDSDKNVTASFGMPDIAVSPDAYDYGDVTIKQSSNPATFTIQNNGTGDLNKIKMKIIGTDAKMFKIRGSCKKAIIPGANCQFTVTFKPKSSGLKTAAVQIISNDPNAATIEIPLEGNGI